MNQLKKEEKKKKEKKEKSRLTMSTVMNLWMCGLNDLIDIVRHESGRCRCAV